MGSSFIAEDRPDNSSQDVVYSGTEAVPPTLFVHHFHASRRSELGAGIRTGSCPSLLLFLHESFPVSFPGPHLVLGWYARLGLLGKSYLISLIAATPLYVILSRINLQGPEENAYFYVAWAISALLFSIPTSLGQSLFAEFT